MSRFRQTVSSIFDVTRLILLLCWYFPRLVSLAGLFIIELGHVDGLLLTSVSEHIRGKGRTNVQTRSLKCGWLGACHAAIAASRR